MNQNVEKQQNFIKWLKETPTYTTTIAQSINTTQATTTRNMYKEEQFRNATNFLQQETSNKFSTNTKKVSGKPKPDNYNRHTNITTQIAKISYKSDLSSNRRSASKERFTESHRNNDDNISHITHESKTSLNSDIKKVVLEENKTLLKEFAIKKQERDQEISEIQEMLNKIKPPKNTTSHSMEELEKYKVSEEGQAPEKVKEINAKEMPMPTFRRSKTEIQMHSNSKTQEETLYLRNSRRDTARSSVSQINKPRSKSSQLPITQKDSEPAKKIGYNPVDARRFMENQKKQRKSNIANNQADNTKMEKEKIKKRLEELKKNSRKLVSKNLQKKQNNMTNKQTFKEQEDTNLDLKPKETVIITKSMEHKELTDDLKGLSLDLQRTYPLTCKTDRPKSTKKTISEVTSKSTYSLTTILAPPAFPLLENHKRIGLLRKSENDKDFSITSHRAINLDKENHALEQLTNKLNTPLEVRQNKERKEIKDKPLESLKTQEIESESNEKFEAPKDSSQSSKNLKIEEQVSDLEVPQHTLKTKESKEPLKNQTFRKENLTEKSSKPNDLPYWLRPTAAQVYPYNFIMAVRRKLEAIAQPNSQVISSKQHQCTSTTDLDIDLQHKQKKRKSLEYPAEHEVKKLKKKVEDDTNSSKEGLFMEPQKPIETNSEAKIEEQTIEPLKRRDNSKQDLASIKQLKPFPKSISSYRLEGPKPKYPEETVSQFQYLQKSIQTKDFVDAKPINCLKSKTKSFMDLQTIPPYKPLQKPAQSPSSDQEEHNEISLQFKLPKNFKSTESLNSEIHSNLSSISLHNPISNTLTEVSSLRTESQRTFIQSNRTQHGSEDDKTSISSHIFSSPEKKFTKYHDFEFTKPRPVSPLSLEKVDKLKIKRKDHGNLEKDFDNDDIEMDFSQLLEDFNRSLSQVIQVNEKLKCTLDKSQQILSPRTSKKSSESDKQYSSDFESSTQHTKHSMESEKFKENLQNNNVNLKQRKQQLFEMAKKVKPLLTPQKSFKDTENVMPKKDKDEPMPEINLKSLNNSSNLSQEDTANTTGNKVVHKDLETLHGYEERQQQIEQLKLNLKETLLESQQERPESERLKANDRKSKNYMIKEHKEIEAFNGYNQETKNDVSIAKPSTSVHLISRKERKELETLNGKGSNDYKENKNKHKNELENTKVQMKQSGNETLYEHDGFYQAALSINKKILNENTNITQTDSAEQSEKGRFKENPKNYHNEHTPKEKYRKQYKKSLVKHNGNETQSTFQSSQTSGLDSCVASSQNVKNSNEDRYGNETYLNKKSLETHNQSSYITNSSETQYSYSNSSQSASKAQNRPQNYRDSKTLTDNSLNQSANNSNNSSPVKSLSTNPTHTSMETPKSIRRHTNSQSNNQTSKLVENESATHKQRQNEIESVAPNEDKSQSKSQQTSNQPDALSSSIAEDLQNTFETASQDNENIPMRQSTSSQSTKNNDSLAFINCHVNRSRGDFQQTVSNAAKLNETKFQQAILAAAHLSSTEFAQSADDEVTSSEPSKTTKAQSSNPPSYNAISSSKHHKHPLITSSPSKPTRRMSIGSEIVKFFHQYDSERTQSRSKINDTMSESSLNYSNIGLYDKLIQNETSKSQHLTALLKMREKALLDRTKGQIAWLEVQKARYKAKGLISHIAAIKKKQRGILLKMEKEREEIKRYCKTFSYSRLLIKL